MSSNNFGKDMVLIWSEDLGVEYVLGNNRIDAVRKADIRILRGEYVAATGLFGPDRNCFLNVLGCLEKPHRGKYIFDYDDVALLDKNQLAGIRKDKIGFTFPNCNLFDEYSIMENIGFPLKYSGLKKPEKQALVEKAARRAGLDEELTLEVGHLTVFQKQKVAIARAVVHDPLLLIACEPAFNVNHEEAGELMKLLDSLNREGMAIILVSDKEQLVACAPRKIRFENGVIAADEYDFSASCRREVCAECRE